MDTNPREPLTVPDDKAKVLMHSCCAPCAGEIMEAMAASKIDLTVFFYNPNIHPRREYEIRKQENIRFAQKMNIPFVDADYDTDHWFKRVKGLEWAPERGERCTVCFDMRFERTALYASEHGFSVITSSLGLSRWKDMNQINGCGVRAASRYPQMVYWTYNWRKQGGSQRMYEIAKREEFYQQEYCGCVYSLRDTNIHRVKRGAGRIDIGKRFYSFDEEARMNQALDEQPGASGCEI
jgi:predicted adenine nucleotide alpha hydrolase (AANH) superfamily ATPase